MVVKVEVVLGDRVLVVMDGGLDLTGLGGLGGGGGVSGDSTVVGIDAVIDFGLQDKTMETFSLIINLKS